MKIIIETKRVPPERVSVFRATPFEFNVTAASMNVTKQVGSVVRSKPQAPSVLPQR
jgi:hypothetical protein